MEFVLSIIVSIIIVLVVLGYLWQQFMKYLPRIILAGVAFVVLCIIGGISLLFEGGEERERASWLKDNEDVTAKWEEWDWFGDDGDAEDGLARLIDGYLLNYEANNIEALADFVERDAGFYAEQHRYMQSLRERDVQLELVAHTIVSAEQLDASTYEVITEEAFVVWHPGEQEKEVSQTIRYEVTLKGQQLLVSDLVVLESE